MPLVGAGQTVYQVKIQTNTTIDNVNKPILNIMNYIQNTGASLGDSAVASAWIAANQANWIACLNAGATMATISVRQLSLPTDPFSVTSIATPGGVGSLAAALPQFNAAYLQFNTGARGRGYRGGIHFGTLDRSFINATKPDEFTAGAVTAFGTLGTSLVAPLTVSGQSLQLCVVQYSQSQLNVTTPTIYATGVTSVVLRPQVGTMTHRKEKK